MRYDLTLMQVQSVKAMLHNANLDNDDQLVIDTLEGETDAFELGRKLLNHIEREEGDKAALLVQIEDRKTR